MAGYLATVQGELLVKRLDCGDVRVAVSHRRRRVRRRGSLGVETSATGATKNGLTLRNESCCILQKSGGGCLGQPRFHGDMRVGNYSYLGRILALRCRRPHRQAGCSRSWEWYQGEGRGRRERDPSPLGDWDVVEEGKTG